MLWMCGKPGARDSRSTYNPSTDLPLFDIAFARHQLKTELRRAESFALPSFHLCESARMFADPSFWRFIEDPGGALAADFQPVLLVEMDSKHRSDKAFVGTWKKPADRRDELGIQFVRLCFHSHFRL